MTTSTDSPAGLSRRGLLGLALGAGAAGLAVGAGAGAAAGVAVGRARERDAAASVYDFFGAHQAGITTPVQDHLHFASFDMMARTKRDDLVSLLQDWSYAASRMTRGLDVSATGAVGGDPEAPPDDTGEALGLPPSGLTITFGFGPTLFETADGVDRYGIAGLRPPELAKLPPFLGDDLDPASSNGDLCIQACADDPQVAVHAVRNLSRIAFGRARIRWSQLGFGRTSKTTQAQETPRNLFGFKDGTANILADDTAGLDEHVWVAASDRPAWMAGGSYLVARKIAMIIELWDRQRLSEQHRIIGRDKIEGAPMSGGDDEFAPLDFEATDAAGEPLIDVAAHVRLAHPAQNGGTRILRRGYNFVDGNTGRPARRWPLLPVVPAVSRAVHGGAADAVDRLAQRVPPARRLRGVGDPSRRAARVVRGGGPVRLSELPPDRAALSRSASDRDAAARRPAASRAGGANPSGRCGGPRGVRVSDRRRAMKAGVR